MQPCAAPGCIRYARIHVYCDPHTKQWLATGVRPFVHMRNVNGVPDARVEMLRDAEEQNPGFLLAHVQRLFDERLGEPGEIRGAFSRWELELKHTERVALREARRDNAAYAQERARERSRSIA